MSRTQVNRTSAMQYWHDSCQGPVTLAASWLVSALWEALKSKYCTFGWETCICTACWAVLMYLSMQSVCQSTWSAYLLFPEVHAFWCIAQQCLYFLTHLCFVKRFTDIKLSMNLMSGWENLKKGRTSWWGQGQSQVEHRNWLNDGLLASRITCIPFA